MWPEFEPLQESALIPCCCATQRVDEARILRRGCFRFHVGVTNQGREFTRHALGETFFPLSRQWRAPPSPLRSASVKPTFSEGEPMHCNKALVGAGALVLTAACGDRA